MTTMFDIQPMAEYGAETRRQIRFNRIEKRLRDARRDAERPPFMAALRANVKFALGNFGPRKAVQASRS